MLLNGLFKSSSHHSHLIKKITANTFSVTNSINRQLIARQVNHHHHFTTNRSTYLGYHTVETSKVKKVSKNFEGICIRI